MSTIAITQHQTPGRLEANDLWRYGDLRDLTISAAVTVTNHYPAGAYIFRLWHGTTIFASTTQAGHSITLDANNNLAGSISVTGANVLELWYAFPEAKERGLDIRMVLSATLTTTGVGTVHVASPAKLEYVPQG